MTSLSLGIGKKASGMKPGPAKPKPCPPCPPPKTPKKGKKAK